MIIKEKSTPLKKGAICNNGTTGALFRYPFFLSVYTDPQKLRARWVFIPIGNTCSGIHLVIAEGLIDPDTFRTNYSNEGNFRKSHINEIFLLMELS